MNSDLLARCREAEDCVVIQGEIAEDDKLDYMRDVIGIGKAFFEQGAAGILDMLTVRKRLLKNKGITFRICNYGFRNIYILPFALGGICGIIIGFIEFCNIYKAKNSQNIQRIPGIVDLIVTQNSRYPIGLPMVEFVYKGTKVRKRIILQGDLKIKYKTGDKVIVLFDPMYQKEKVRIEEENSYLKPVGTIILGFIVLSASLIFMYVLSH